MSYFSRQPPETVYQTVWNGALQDSSSLQAMEITLCDGTLAALDAAGDASLHGSIFVALRRFDGVEIEKYNADLKTMLGLRLSQDAFVFDRSERVLRIGMHRKELPVSMTFGGAPYVLVVLFKAVNEAVTSSPFMVVSKEFNAAMKPRTRGVAPPKRARAVPRAAPWFDVAIGFERIINDMTRMPAAETAAPDLALLFHLFEDDDFEPF